MLKKELIIGVAAIACLVWFAPSVFAIEPEGETRLTQSPRPPETTRLNEDTEKVQKPTESYEQKLTDKRTTLEVQIKEQTRTKPTEKLDDAKKKICETKADGIKTRMEKIGETGQQHREFLSSVVEKINAFISKNSLVVENYDAMVADIDNAKASLEASHEVLKSYKDQFSCDGDPKAVASEFQAALQSMKDAEKTYKASVKTLLDAVKLAAQNTGIAPAPKNSSSSNETTSGGTR